MQSKRDCFTQVVVNEKRRAETLKKIFEIIAKVTKKIKPLILIRASKTSIAVSITSILILLWPY